MSEAPASCPPPPAHFEGADRLNPEVYQELRKLAARRMAQHPDGSTLQPTVLVHEAWLRLRRRPDPWLDRAHFLASAVTAMRHILIDHARHKSRLRHGGGHVRADTITLGRLVSPHPDDRLLRIDEGVNELAKIDPVRAHVVVARFFGGLTHHEIAEALGISERGVDRHWAAAKVWLFRWMQADAAP